MPVRYKLDEIDDSMTLGQSLHFPDGRMLLAAGSPLHEKYREKLRQFGYDEIFVQIPGTEEVYPDSVVKTSNLQEILNVTKSTTTELNQEINQLRKNSKARLDEIIKQKSKVLKRFVLPQQTETILDQIISDLFQEKTIILNLDKISSEDETLFQRMVRVTIVSLCLGRKYNYSKDELRQLGAGALHHDFGLALLPPHLWKEERQLSADEQKEYNLHTVYGYTLLSQKQILPPTSRIISLQHHEHQDGSGYPQKLSAHNLPPVKGRSQDKSIHRFAELVAVADAWDIYSSGRARYSESLSTPQAMKSLIKGAGSKWNRDIVQKLISMIPVFPVGSKVRIVESNEPSLIGARAVVARDNPVNLAHPEIIVFEDRDGKRLGRTRRIRTGAINRTKIQLEV